MMCDAAVCRKLEDLADVVLCAGETRLVGDHLAGQAGQALLVGVGVLDDQPGDPLRVPGRQPEAHRSAEVEQVHRDVLQAHGLDEALHHVGEAGERVGEVGGRLGVPEAWVSGATMRWRVPSASISRRNWCDADGKPCRSSSAGASCGPAVR
jgi:hypothetical protein